MSAERSTAYVALGSNLGDRDATLAFAVRALADEAGVDLVAVSPVYETEPVGPPGQGAYLNAVVEVATTLSARDLLDVMLAIEAEAGRSRSGARWGPRTLDLDLLLHGDACIDEPELEVPHPRLHERAFVLVPLCDLAGKLRHPRLGLPLERLLADVGGPIGVTRWPVPLPAR